MSDSDPTKAPVGKGGPSAARACEAMAASLRVGLAATLADIARGLERDLFVLEMAGGAHRGAMAFNDKLYRLRVIAHQLWSDTPTPRPPRRDDARARKAPRGLAHKSAT